MFSDGKVAELSQIGGRGQGLPKARFHDLRHTFATLALQNGVDVKTVSGMLGHYSADFTLDTYAHVTTQLNAKRRMPWGVFFPPKFSAPGSLKAHCVVESAHLFL